MHSATVARLNWPARLPPKLFKISIRQVHHLSRAVIELRTALGDSKQQFAGRLDIALSSVARYETSRPPSGDILRRLAAIANQNGHGEIGVKFERFYLDEVLADMKTTLVVDPEAEDGYLILKLKGREDIEDAVALLRKRRGHPPHEKLQKQLDQLLLQRRRGGSK